MTALFSSAGRAALANLLRGPAIAGFDFDGTLAPIRPTPGEAVMQTDVAAAFADLARRMPVAVVSGRGLADLRARLPGAPRWVLGNHGAEGLPGADPRAQQAHRSACAQWRAQLHGKASLLASGILLEDKRHSLSLHYRLAPDHEAARAALLADVAALRPAPRVVPGKCVLNLVHPDAVDKFGAMRTLAALHGPGTGVFFAGDDDNDEILFRQAPPEWVTVKVGMGETAARFRLPSQESMRDCLALLLGRNSGAAGP